MGNTFFWGTVRGLLFFIHCLTHFLQTNWFAHITYYIGYETCELYSDSNKTWRDKIFNFDELKIYFKTKNIFNLVAKCILKWKCFISENPGACHNITLVLVNKTKEICWHLKLSFCLFEPFFDCSESNLCKLPLR